MGGVTEVLGWEGGQNANTKYTIPNYKIADKYEAAQYLNRLLSQGLCILFHVNIAGRLLIINKFRLNTDYQKLIIVQSVINIIASGSELIMNEIQTINPNLVKIGHPFWQFSTTERLIFSMIMTVSANSTQDFLMLFNLHRLIMIKGKSLIKLYMIVLPLMTLGTLIDTFDSYPVIMRGEDSDLFFKYTQLPVIFIVIFCCYWKLGKEFAKNDMGYSEKTKRLQHKLSLSILLQVIMLIIIAFILAVFPIILYFIVDYQIFMEKAVYYTIVSLIICDWYPFLSAALILWSITGFFKNQSAHNTIAHSDVRIMAISDIPSQRKVSRAV